MLKYGVSTANKVATDVGIQILENGGNAIDAAVAVSFALGVLEPYASGLGGGGAMLIYFKETDNATLIDYREIAPYDGSYIGNIGIPGFVKGMEYVALKYGSMPLKELIEPSIKLARNGFLVGETFAKQLKKAKHLDRKIVQHLYVDENPISVGSQLKQECLALTLQEIATKGSKGFYSSRIGSQISRDMGIELEGLDRYEVVERIPTKGIFNGYSIFSAPSPMGGSLIIQILQTYELLYKNEMYVTDEMKIIDRICSLINLCNLKGYNLFGDPKFNEIEEKYLTSNLYCLELAQILSSKKKPISNVSMKLEDNNNTTHFVIMDKNGTMVSTTNSISNVFGSGKYTNGFFLNNQLKNFSSKKKSPNIAQAGKRPFTLIAPTILKKDGELIGIGSSGGQRIPGILCYSLIELINGKKTISEVINLPRFFNDNLKIIVEKGNAETELIKLVRKGYNIEIFDDNFFFGAMQCLIFNLKHNKLIGAADPRRNGVCVIKD
ncbi:MAG: gamma-glutamyltransferase [Psychrobacillus sp.]